MLQNSKNLKQSYQNNKINTNSTQNLIIKKNDIVRVHGKHYMINSINNNVLTGADMYSNEETFFLDDIEKIIFDSNSQTNIQDFLYTNEKNMLIETLKDITNKLNSSHTSIKHIKNLKTLKRKTLEKLNSLELKKIQIA